MSCHAGNDSLSGGFAGTYEFSVDSAPETGTVSEGTDMIKGTQRQGNENGPFRDVRMERIW